MKNRLNNIYWGMKKRCYNPSNQNYKYYGARGITICDEWKNDFKTFKNWALQNGYSDRLTIDRIDTSAGYSPINCRWITQKEQCHNRRSNRLITYKGKTQTLGKWCEELNLDYKNIETRINRYHWEAEKAFEVKNNFRMVMITYKGKTQKLKDWCIELGLNYKTTHTRIKRGWSIEKAFQI